MTQTKKTYPQAAVKMAGDHPGARQMLDAAETTRQSAEKVVKMGSEAMKDFLSTSAGEAQKAQEKILSMGRENAEHMAKSADSLTRMMQDSVAGMRENVEACIECGNRTADLVKDMGGEVVESANRAFSDGVEMSKAFFSCRTLSDMIEMSNRMVKSATEQLFSQSSKFSDMAFEYASEVMEPVNERVAKATSQISKAMSSN